MNAVPDKPDLPSSLERIFAVTVATLEREGIERGVAAALAERITMEFSRSFGGAPLYIPRNDKVRREMRNLRILSDRSTGLSIEDLARKYRLSTVAIYSILRGKKRDYPG